jgi:hypothetical protein
MGSKYLTNGVLAGFEGKPESDGVFEPCGWTQAVTVRLEQEGTEETEWSKCSRLRCDAVSCLAVMQDALDKSAAGGMI